MEDYHQGNIEMSTLQRNAEAGDTLAQYELASVLSTGFLGEDKIEDSFYWYMKAALRGHVESIWNAGLQLVEGKVIERDIEAGLHLIHMAAKERCYGALRFLGHAYHSGLHGLYMDKQKGEFWYLLADKYKDIDTPSRY
ncbi:MAG: hypothetical protein P8163_19140 [Candidatus Thiodiazotropha sp.]